MKSMEPDARALAAALHDGLALCLAFFVATLLLDVDGIHLDEGRMLFAAFAIAVPIQLAINFLFGIYQGIWRYTSLPDIQRIVFSVLTGTVAARRTSSAWLPSSKRPKPCRPSVPRTIRSAPHVLSWSATCSTKRSAEPSNSTASTAMPPCSALAFALARIFSEPSLKIRTSLDKAP